MKNSNTFFFALFIVGLFNIPTQAQSVTDTPQFHFPLEVGNIWVYRDYEFPACEGLQCEYVRLEIIENLKRSGKTCASFQKDSYQIHIYSNEIQSYLRAHFQLCQEDNRIYWFDEEADVEIDFDVHDMIADFDRNETQPWVIGGQTGNFTLRRLIEKSPAIPHEYFFDSYIAENETDLEGQYGYEFVYSPHQYFRDGIGFHFFGSYPDITWLTGSYLNGVLTGDTTFVYTTSIDDVLQPERSEGPALLPNYPNPFNPSTVVSYRLSVFSDVQIHVMNLLGQKVGTLFDGVQTPGQHSITFDAAGLPSGMYVVVLETAGFRDARKITFLK